MENLKITATPKWDELVTDAIPGFPLQYLPADCATLVRK